MYPFCPTSPHLGMEVFTTEQLFEPQVVFKLGDSLMEGGGEEEQDVKTDMMTFMKLKLLVQYIRHFFVTTVT